jgi:molecular chaperone DnaK (HSP70)
LIVCDAGGGTIDISTYEVTSTYPAIEVKENGVSDCILGGSATVDHRAMLYLQERLKGTRWDNVEDMRNLRQTFATSIKETFTNSQQEQILLPVGSSSENDADIRLRRGKLVFTGKEIAGFFEPSIAATAESIRQRVKSTNGTATIVAMVGGFSESIYFRRELQQRLGGLVQLCKPDESTAKAVASGALVWVIDGVVGSRVSRHSFGIKCSTVYRTTEAKHLTRANKAYGGVDGVKHLPDAFGSILKKGESGRDDEEHVAPFVLTWVPSVPCTAK